MRSRKNTKIIKRTVTYVILILGLIWTVFPLYWMVKSSFTVANEMYVARPKMFQFTATFDHYIDLIQNVGFLTNIKNSLIIAGITTVVGLIISIFASYAMTKIKISGKKIFQWIGYCFLPFADSGFIYSNVYFCK